MAVIQDWSQPGPNNTCHTCYGDGEIGINSEEGPEECPDCDGTGIESHVKCIACSGTGDDPASARQTEEDYGPGANCMPCNVCGGDGNVLAE